MNNQQMAIKDEPSRHLITFNQVCAFYHKQYGAARKGTAVTCLQILLAALKLNGKLLKIEWGRGLHYWTLAFFEPEP
ncbi:MAG TPA: hypothetical protein ENJ93_04540 [Chloroflexi bacterium]|nr:hypothetical protein [Chloroflexota bacterium]